MAYQVDATVGKISKRMNAFFNLRDFDQALYFVSVNCVHSASISKSFASMQVFQMSYCCGLAFPALVLNYFLFS